VACCVGCVVDVDEAVKEVKESIEEFPPCLKERFIF
jgi:hypothetical protein